MSFVATLRAAVRVPDRRPPADWARQAVNFGNLTAIKGPYDVDNTPWNREFFRAYADPAVREINYCGPSQESGKTIAAEVALLHRLTHAPTAMAYNITTNMKARKWANTRWERALKSCPEARDRFSANRHDKTKSINVFKDGTFLLMQGAETPDNRAGDSVEVQVNDEVRLWESGNLEEMIGRTLAYHQTRKVINISIGGKIGGDWNVRWKSGNQMEWCHRCPNCGTVYRYVHDPRSDACNIHYDMTTAKLGEDGSLDLREFEKTVYVTCGNPACSRQIRWDRGLLRRLNAGGLMVPQNPAASPEIVSIRVNAFAIGARPWHEILAPWVMMHLRGGLLGSEAHERFITDAMADFWDRKPIVLPAEIKTHGYRRRDVLKPGLWADEAFRVMAVDNQRGAGGDYEHRWFLARAFSKRSTTGMVHSRLIDCGRIDTWEQLREKQLEIGIPIPSKEKPGPHLVVDARYDPVSVYEKCALYGWAAFLAQDQEDFVHGPGSVFEGTRQLFSEPRYYGTGYGTAKYGAMTAICFTWSHNKIHDHLAHYRKADLIQVPDDIMEFCPEYAVHMNGRRHSEIINKRTNEKRLRWVKISGHPEHLFSCETMIDVIGHMAGVYKRD